MSEEIKDIFECLRKYVNLTPDAIDDLHYLEGYIEDLHQRVEKLEERNNNLRQTYQETYKEYKQLENIRKEAIEYLKKREYDNYSCSVCSVISDDLLNILNKGSEKS